MMNKITLISKRRRLSNTTETPSLTDIETIVQATEQSLIDKGLVHPHQNKDILDGLTVDQNNVASYNGVVLAVPLVSNSW
jgi:hypothetical protein